MLRKGYPLPVTNQQDIRAWGHSIEARIYAENPRNNFLPATGKLTFLDPPHNSPNLRVESGVRSTIFQLPGCVSLL